MLKRLAPVALLLVGTLTHGTRSPAGEVVRVQGNPVKWSTQGSDRTTEITYVTLAGKYVLPRGESTLSPDNCGAMEPFAEIPAASSELTVDTVKGELRAAFSAWENVAGVKFTEVLDTDRANIVIGSTITSNGRAFANLSLKGAPTAPTVAKALGASSNSAASPGADKVKHGADIAIERAYICVNPKVRWKTGFDGDLDVYDLRYTFMHEIGHAIGLDHPGRSGSIMGYRYDERVRELRPSDIAAVQDLYGPPSKK